LYVRRSLLGSPTRPEESWSWCWPDFRPPIIYGRNGIRSAASYGARDHRPRARAAVERLADREAIIVTEIPYQTNNAKLIERTLIWRDKRLEGLRPVTVLTAGMDSHRAEEDEPAQVVLNNSTN
jgi:DNA gyrase/topoisomerase IV subunit A